MHVVRQLKEGHVQAALEKRFGQGVEPLEMAHHPAVHQDHSGNLANLSVKPDVAAHLVVAGNATRGRGRKAEVSRMKWTGTAAFSQLHFRQRGGLEPVSQVLAQSCTRIRSEDTQSVPRRPALDVVPGAVDQPEEPEVEDRRAVQVARKQADHRLPAIAPITAMKSAAPMTAHTTGTPNTTNSTGPCS